MSGSDPTRVYPDSIPVNCPRCGKSGFTVRAISNTDTSLVCLECSKHVILQQGDTYWDEDRRLKHMALKDMVNGAVQ